MTQTVLLAIDCGTQSLKALLFSETGKLLDKASQEYPPYYSLYPGWAEQDPELYWKSLCLACTELKNRSSILFDRVSGVGLTCQRNSMINVDKQGNPLRAAMIWLDQRRAQSGDKTEKILGLAGKVSRAVAMVSGIRAGGACNWIRQHQPRLWEDTWKYLQVSGFLNYRLTGCFSDSLASQIGHIPFHYRKQRWAGKAELPSLLFPVEHKKLPLITVPGGILGHITAKAFRETGIKQGVPVIACGSDKGCETLGAGVIDSTRVSLSLGTMATLQTTTKRYFEPVRFMPAYPSPIPGCYNPEIEIFRGYWMITWFKQQFAAQEVLASKKKGTAVEKELDHLLKKTRPGAMGLTVQPLWNPGPDRPMGKGAMIGFGDVHTRAHIYRAVIEGLGFALFEGLENMKKRGKINPQKAVVSGGASQSDEICRITADIFNLPMVRGATHETSALGAAMITAAGVGLFENVQQAARIMVEETTCYFPDRSNHALYKKLYAGVYKKMYRRLEPLYASIKSITGYPE